MLKIFCQNTGSTLEFKEGTTLLDMIPSFDFEKPYELICARVNNVPQGLKYRVFNNRNVEFLDYTSYIGRNVYTRSLCFLLCFAARRIFPGCK
ncbi:MAG: nucleoside kinase, partial [Bacteroidales bacterium]|nr:nucleoside kinase [Bacteroidales bacterium]